MQKNAVEKVEGHKPEEELVELRVNTTWDVLQIAGRQMHIDLCRGFLEALKGASDRASAANCPKRLLTLVVLFLLLAFQLTQLFFLQFTKLIFTAIVLGFFELVGLVFHCGEGRRGKKKEGCSINPRGFSFSFLFSLFILFLAHCQGETKEK